MELINISIIHLKFKMSSSFFISKMKLKLWRNFSHSIIQFKFKMWPSFFLCELPIQFSTATPKLAHNFSQFIYFFKIWIFKCLFWAVYTYKLFAIQKKTEGKFKFLKSLGHTSKFFLIH